VKTLWLLLSACSGAFVMSIIDLIQKGPASSIVQISQKVSENLQIYFPPVYSIFLIILITAISALVFIPSSQQQSFMRGMGILGVLMAGTPYTPTPSLGSEMLNPVENRSLLDFGLVNSAYAGDRATVKLAITTSDGRLVKDALISLLDPITRVPRGQSRILGSKYSFPVDPGSYILVVEVSGYSKYENSLTIESGRLYELNVNLK